MIHIYKILGLMFIPIIKINIFLRIQKGKELKLRYKERYGKSTLSFKNNKKIIWIHAASLGEFKSSDYFIKKYSRKFNILVTTTTVSAAELAIKKYGDEIIHQFAPLDVDIWINKFLNYWKPSFIIWIESDLWPTTLHNIKKKNIKAILVNLRLSPKSLKRWKLFPSFYNNLLNCFSYIFAQSELDQKRIKEISNIKINFIGNLKLTQENIDLKKNYKTKVNKDNNTKILMLASTHDNEELMLMPSIKELLNEYKNLKIIIAPRHPNRSKELISLCSSFNLQSKLLTEINSEYNKIIIIDSFGILTNYYNISDIVFLGGSLIPAGGHNPIEPASNKCAIITGQNIFNWQNIFDSMSKENACIKIDSAKNFKNILKILLDDYDKIKDMKKNSFNFSQKQFVDTEPLNKIINEYLYKC